MVKIFRLLLAIMWAGFVCRCASQVARSQEEVPVRGAPSLAMRPTAARAADGTYISWREHLIDSGSPGVVLQGSDGLVMADLDKDGHLDVVSVHESDTVEYGVPAGYIRLAFGSTSPDEWALATLASGAEAAAAEDVAVADLNGDGYLDIVAACELAHLIYFQNPIVDTRTARWPRVIPPATKNRGSYIRVFFADFNRDGRPEVVSPNKGAQSPRRGQPPTAISWFEIKGDPLIGDSWMEHELARVVWPINSQPVDLDADGDLDIIGGSVAETRMLFFENLGERGTPSFEEHPITVAGTSLADAERPLNRRMDRNALVSGFNMDFVDLSGEGRLDIVTFESVDILGRSIVWLEQPESPSSGDWRLHEIGDYAPDEVVGIAAADINSDGLPDVMTGGYSGGARNADDDTSEASASGRLAWYQNPGNIGAKWTRHDISRRRRGMFDKFVPQDVDGDGDVDFASTRGNSDPYDGVFWLEQVRTTTPVRAFEQARDKDSPEIPLPLGR